MNLTEQLAQANEQAIVAHRQAAAIAHELMVALNELGKVYECYKLRVQIDYHNSVVETLERGEFGL